MKLLEPLGGFRTHLLIPGEVVGSVIDDQPTFHGINLPDILKIERDNGRVTVTAQTDVWVQEMGLTVKVQGDGTWRGIGRWGQWTSPPYSVKQRDAHRSTIHFPRYKSRNYTIAVQYREGDRRWRFTSDPGFSRLLGNPARLTNEWKGCNVFNRGWKLAGVVPKTNESPIRVWELAGHSHEDGDFWMHFHGWSGGAGAVVQNVPPYRADQILHPDAPIDHLWDPVSWRHMRPGQSISQTLVMEER